MARHSSRRTYGAGVQWMAAWDSPAQIGWNTVALGIHVGAVVSWRRTPVEAFARSDVGRWWTLAIALAVTAVLGGYWLPVGAAVWFAYWRPRLRRGAVAASIATTRGRGASTVPGEPLI